MKRDRPIDIEIRWKIGRKTYGYIVYARTKWDDTSLRREMSGTLRILRRQLFEKEPHEPA